MAGTRKRSTATASPWVCSGNSGGTATRPSTLSGALQTLIYLGNYDEALAWAGEARVVFTRQRDRLRLARLDSNLGNVLYRQGRFDEALTVLPRTCRIGRRRRAQDITVTLRNMAVCHISLNAFPAALRTYQRARAYRSGKPCRYSSARPTTTSPICTTFGVSMPGSNTWLCPFTGLSWYSSGHTAPQRWCR